ncbi:hypothetical protein AQUCO_02700428v1 [Aquilegia coerulea]|uniref:non-specific serine/threonine protein kinase n=2 Tax=Aquilegia coerulea TaxID=218851 RepID=A0A2G5D6V1_AQUCA|nr:hypothetical protein AQUCO_02700428v1 [Aquilegia coerulea]
MGSLPGTCEIVEATDECDSVQHFKGINLPSSRSRMDEKVGKLPMLKTGRNCALEEDLNHIFEAIDRRTAARSLALSHQSVIGMSTKNASKRPVRVGASQPSGIGISESVSLKQALRGLRISHASEMAAMKRSSKPIGSPVDTEAGALQRLYRSVVVEANESDFPLDERKGSVLEITLVPEKSEAKYCHKRPDSIQDPMTSSTSSARSSPRFAAATKTKGKSMKTGPPDENILKSIEIGGRLVQEENRQYSPSLSNSATDNKLSELEEIVPSPKIIGSKISALELVRKGQLHSSVHSSSGSKTASKGSKSASSSPRALIPVVTAKAKTTKMRPQDDIVAEPTSTNKTSKSPSNSPRLVKPIVTNGLTAKPTTPKTCSQDEVFHESAAFGGKKQLLKVPQKGKLKHALASANSNTIKKVLEIEEVIHAVEDAGSKTSTPKVARKGELYSDPSLCVSIGTSKASKSAGNSPRVIKPVSKHTTSVKKTVKQEAASVTSSSTTYNQAGNDDILSGTNDLVCRTRKCNQKSMRKESGSPASSSRSLSGKVSSSNHNSGASKSGFDSNSCNERVISVKASEKSRFREKGDISQSSKSSSIGEYSSSTSISEESSLSASSSGGSRPHMSKDLRWDAIRHVKMRYGSLGLRNFKLLKRLGCGDIGTVYLAELSGANCLFALKVMDNEFLASRRKMPRAQTEREILQMLDHPFLPTLYAHFTTDKFSCLVMEYCPGGDLHVLRQKQANRSFSEQAARFYVAEVLLALEYLHMLGVVYRDLKPENILVREDGHIMLSDFDLSLRCVVSPTLLKSSLSIVEPAKKFSGPCAESSCIDPFCIQPSWGQVSCFSPRLISATKARKLKADLASQVRPLPQLVAEPTSARSNSFVGTHEYLAPEIIKGDGHGSAVDWWTFGIFLYELLFGKTPFKGPGNEDTLANVVLQSLKFPECPIVSFQAKDLIRGLLVKEPENRLGSIKGATEIKQHPFFEGLNWALIRCAIPPELPKPYDPVSMACEKEVTKCPEFKNTGDHFEFELF